MKPKKFTCYDLFVNLISLITFLLDIGTDVLVVVEFYEGGHIVWGSLSIVFICLPAIVMQFFSIKWYHNDGKLTICTFLPHLLLIGPVFRYLGVIKVGLRARQKAGDVCRDTSIAFSQQNDISILRLIEAFMESAPQLGLQLYIVLTTLHIDWLTGISIASSLISLSWAVTAYTDALRLAYQTGYSRRWFGLIMHSLWRTCMTSARITALVLFSVVFKGWIFLVAGTHWLVMTIIISVQGTDFGDGCFETSMFRLVAGFIHIFCFLNVKDGRTRRRITAFYFLILLENAALWTLWFIYTDSPELVTVTACIVFGAFILGLIFLMIYYRFLHPSGEVHLFNAKPTVYEPTIMPSTTPKRERREIFNTSDSILDYNQSCNAVIDLSRNSPADARGPFVHSAANTPCPQNATDRNLMAIWESSSRSAHAPDGNVDGDQMIGTQSKTSCTTDDIIYQKPTSQHKDGDYSIVFNEGTDGLMFRIRSQKDLREGDCSPYSVTSLSVLNSKAGSLSPLDAHKLWEESKRRMLDSPLSSPSSTSTINKSLFGNPDGIRRMSRSSSSSTTSSKFFDDNNITVREAMPPQDEPALYHCQSSPVVINSDQSRYVPDTSTISIPTGSVLKLLNPQNDSTEIRNNHPEYLPQGKYTHGSIYSVPESALNPNLQKKLDDHLYESINRKHVSFSNNLEIAPEYSRFDYPVLNVQPSVMKSRISYESSHISPYESSNGTSISPLSPLSNISSSNSLEEPAYVNSSVLSGNSCCSPSFPFIDESCSEAGSTTSSVKPPCNPITCYMSAVTQLADNEVAETLKIDTEKNEKQSEMNQNQDYSEHNNLVRIGDGQDSLIQKGCPPPYDIACQRSKTLSLSSESSCHEPNTVAVMQYKGFDPSSFPISSSRPTDFAWRLDYLNIEPSPSLSLNSQTPQGTLMQKQQTKYPSKLNVSDPGSTPLKLQNFDESPCKFGRNIDLFKKGDWASDDFVQPSQQTHSRKPRVDDFKITVLKESPSSHNRLDMSDGQTKENSYVDPKGLSPPLKSSSLHSSLARKRSISRRNSQRKNDENRGHYVKAQPAGSKFSGIKRHSDYVQYSKTAKDRQNGQPLRQRKHNGNKVNNENVNDVYMDSYPDIRGSIRQPFKSLENSPGFSPTDLRKPIRKTQISRFDITPKKTSSLNVISDYIVHDKPIQKWAHANLNKLTPDGKSKNSRRKSSYAYEPNSSQNLLSKTRSMEHLY
ncbi:hypothetical protein SNE40_011932 [Patella caerulea]|uniref:XK-related protein n=1 Tax=Patella caerulea TaxID=87958 RepID=A0AAN8JR32_PATCE